MTSETLDKLNQLLAILKNSFPQYLQYSRPYVPPGRGETLEALAAIALDQQSLADRVSRIVYEGGDLPQAGEFPIEFTDMHDLSVDFLVNATIFYQQQDVEAIARLVDQLQTAPAAKAIAEEALGLAKGHLDALRELLQPTGAT